MRIIQRSRLVPVLLSLVLGLGLALQAAPAQAKSKSSKVNLNTATQQELEALPGVGEATAKKIIAARPYSSVDDLSKAGVPASTISKLKSKVTVGSGSASGSSSASSSSEKAAASGTKKSTSTKSSKSTEKPEAKESSSSKAAAEPKSAGTGSHGGRIDVNTATEAELEALPGIGASSAKKIIAARPYTSLDDLSRSGVAASSLEKARPQLMVSHAQKVAPAVPAVAGTGAGASSQTRSEPARSSATSTSTSSSTSSASTRSSAKAPATEEEGEPEVAARTAPAAGMVWVNTSSKIYHYEGDRWYGKTKEGKFMKESDAIKAGYRASKEGAPKQ